MEVTTLLSVLIIINMLVSFLLIMGFIYIAFKQWLFDKVLTEMTKKILGQPQKKPQFVMTPNGLMPIPSDDDEDEEEEKKEEKEQPKADYFG